MTMTQDTDAITRVEIDIFSAIDIVDVYPGGVTGLQEQRSRSRLSHMTEKKGAK
jgi:hypothetical protein